MRVEKTRYYSYKLGELPKGCKLCVKGSKLVVFITGLCPRNCYFCPISDEKYNKDIIYADEWKIEDVKDLIAEAKLINAEGAGITGGDPLCKLDRTIKYIKLLKKEFGKSFHIHLYTSLDLVNKENLARLYEAGLDEIRFHLDLNDKKYWGRIKLAFDFEWDVGVELPVIPEEKFLKDIILFIKENDKIKFLNLNELEVSDNKQNKLLEKGFTTKDDISYAVKSSEEYALELLRFAAKEKIKFNIHYCTSKLKDRVQLTNRIKRRAKNVANNFDIITDEGTLIRGVFYLKELSPGFDYRKKLDGLKNKKDYLKKLLKLRDYLINKYGIKEDFIDIDELNLRLLTSKNIILSLRGKLKREEFMAAVVEEYPTQDCLEVEIDFIS
ncbi:MAG: radical SAM protein [Candidatus Nanoarchaeia archaeon]|nr:radical SAM protein [Candidatus Nanoarchaeia archaeon]